MIPDRSHPTAEQPTRRTFRRAWSRDQSSNSLRGNPSSALTASHRHSTEQRLSRLRRHHPLPRG